MAFLSSCRKPKYLLIMVLGCNSELFYFPFPSKKGNYNSPSRIFSSLSAQVSLGVSGCSQIPNLYQRPLPHPCSAPAPRSSARDNSGLFFPADRGPHVLHIGSYPGELAIPWCPGRAPLGDSMRDTLTVSPVEKGPDCRASLPEFATSWLCDLGQVI